MMGNGEHCNILQKELNAFTLGCYLPLRQEKTLTKWNSRIIYFFDIYNFFFRKTLPFEYITVN